MTGGTMPVIDLRALRNSELGCRIIRMLYPLGWSVARIARAAEISTEDMRAILIALVGSGELPPDRRTQRHDIYAATFSEYARGVFPTTVVQREMSGFLSILTLRCHSDRLGRDFPPRPLRSLVLNDPHAMLWHDLFETDVCRRPLVTRSIFEVYLDLVWNGQVPPPESLAAAQQAMTALAHWRVTASAILVPPLPGAYGTLEQTLRRLLDKNAYQALAQSYGWQKRPSQINQMRVLDILFGLERQEEMSPLKAGVPQTVADILLAQLGLLRKFQEAQSRAPLPQGPLPQRRGEDALDFASEEVIKLISRTAGKLRLGTRARRRLERAHIEYIWQLIEKTEQELLQIDGLGQGTLQEIERVLSRYGLRLATVIPPQVRATLPGASST